MPCLDSFRSETRRDLQPSAQSHVRVSFDVPHLTVALNAIGAMNVLVARQIVPNARIYQASSSEMFGNSYDLTFIGAKRLDETGKSIWLLQSFCL